MALIVALGHITAMVPAFIEFQGFCVSIEMPRSRKEPSVSECLTVGEAASILHVSVDTLRYWDRTGKLRAYRHPMNKYRLFIREEVERVHRMLRRLSRDVHSPGEGTEEEK